MVIIAKELYEYSIRITEQHCCFARIYYLIVLFLSRKESTVKLMMYDYSVSVKAYVSILSSLVVLMRLI